ncbi:glucose 1-dehydrogenase [Paenibacillus odorifer]|uniref:glucose 1-dehydrogenase n=1 Tax=Paenibacillus odorifer TaxID=189426 RepID=UPI00096CB0FD|nr:glucose 1-dehydrogenase [Paenibacillus odorifer]OMD56825.1 3-ketoacyl-ACP reductase [Paenibacillus odorifer]
MILTNKVAVVTGAGSGIGEAIALLFARQGAKVIAADIHLANVEAVAKKAKKGEGHGVVYPVKADVSKEEDTQRMIDAATTQFGGLHILVNNAGIMDKMTPAHEITDDLWEQVLAVNVTGPMRAIRKVLPIFMAQESGCIINVASIGGLAGSRAGVAYTSSKHAVIGMTKNIGFQYAKLGIRCNAIAPGGVKTNIDLSDPSPFGSQKAGEGMASMPRTGESSEIASVALFLASDAASFLNGSVITADAGWMAY